MIKHLLTATLALHLLVHGALAADPNTLTPEESAAGWTLLFDGKSTAGWKSLGKPEFPATGWDVVDGSLHHGKGGGDIVTTKAYTNFELTWEWNIAEGGNSGVKYNLPDANRSLGFEYQLIDDVKHADSIANGPLHQTAALYALIVPAADKKLNPPGQWNQSRLVVDGKHVEHWLNGSKTLSFEMGSAAIVEAIGKSKYKKVPNFGQKIASPILLQDHGDEVFFRSIKLRALPAK